MVDQMTTSERYDRGLVMKRVQMFTKAIEDFQAAAHDPRYTGKAQLQIAQCLKLAGRYEEAVLSFRQAAASSLFSAEERRYILYHLGQLLEAMGRPDESLEVYRWIKKEDPGFHDITQRIRKLSAGGRTPETESRGAWQAWLEEVCARGRKLKPQVNTVLAQTGTWLSRQAAQLTSGSVVMNKRLFSTGTTVLRAPQPAGAARPVQPAARVPGVEKRRHARVPVRLRGHFSAKGRPVAGEGELRDLTPWGCRVTSPLAMAVGASIDCCIFPKDATHPFIIDGATVRWASPREFGLAFTGIRPRVQQRIEQLCRTHVA